MFVWHCMPNTLNVMPCEIGYKLYPYNAHNTFDPLSLALLTIHSNHQKLVSLNSEGIKLVAVKQFFEN
jgi:hypothetical protein